MGKLHWLSAYRRNAATLKSLHIETCHATTGCKYPGQPIRYDLAKPHALSFSAEHDPPVSVAGPHANLLPAHLGCNAAGGAAITNQLRRQRRSPAEPRTSRDWG